MKNHNENPASISVIIPVYNEAGGINSLIDQLMLLQYSGSIEIIVVDGGENQSTLSAIISTGVKKISSAPGRGIQMNTGASHACGDILLFLHADTRLPEGAFSDIRTALNGDNSVAGAFDLGLDNHRIIYYLTGKCASLKHRLTRIPYGDQAIFIKTNYFKEIGGFSEIPLMEDVELMKRIKRRKDRITIINKSVTTSSRKWEKEGVFYTIFRNWTLQALYLWGVSPERLVRYYYGEKKHEQLLGRASIKEENN